jgi:glycolate oxidase iron-sulfur subunit
MLSNYYEEIIRCARCGNCLAFCPVFKEIKKESESARGKMFLVLSYLEKKIELTPLFKEKIYRCLSCFSCSANCPGGVNVPEIIEAMRCELVNKKGLDFTKKIMLGVIQNNFIFSNSLKAIGLLNKISPSFLKNKNRIFSLPEFYFKKYPEIIKAEKPKMKVGIFLGCSFKYIYPEVIENTIKILLKNNIEVIIPEEQTCCGMPFIKAGAYLETLNMIKTNLDSFKKYQLDFIVTCCASCGLMLKKEYKKILGEEVKDFIFQDISEFILKNNLKFNSNIKNLKLTFHDPCHLVRGQGIYQEPREIIRSLKDVEFKESKESDTCCGCAGTFTIYNPELSLKILENKLNRLEETKADVIVTHCPACMVQIQYGFKKRNRREKVVHTLQLIN